MKALAILCLLMFVAMVAYTQVADTASIPQKPTPRFVSNAVFQIDNRNERYLDTRGRMNGLKLGIEFYKRVRTGFGFYANSDYYIIAHPLWMDSIQRTARFGYATFFTELVLFRNFRWEISTIGAIGSGNLQVNSFDVKTGTPRFVGSAAFPDVGVRDIAINTQFKFFPWLGLGMGLGYRNVRNLPDDNLRNAFTVNYIDFKVKIFIGYAVRAIFSPEKIEAERAYYDYRKEQRIKAIKTIVNK